MIHPGKAGSDGGFPVKNDVVSTSMRRDHVALTLIRRYFNVVCLLGCYSLIQQVLDPSTDSQSGLILMVKRERAGQQIRGVSE